MFQFTDSLSKSTFTVWFYVDPTPITSSILGGNQIKEIIETFNVTSIAQDPDEPPENRTRGFNRGWSCINLNTNEPCRDLAKKLIEVPDDSRTH